jgi:methyl-accepting chemotaxis protein/hemerythrin
MSCLLWNNEDYSVHILSIDNEHKILLALVNELESAMNFHILLQAKFMLDKIAHFSNCIRNHIASEERFLLSNKYPELATHQLKHAEIIERLNKFESWFKECNVPFNEKMILFLKDLLVRHFILHDRKYGTYYLDKDLSCQPE